MSTTAPARERQSLVDALRGFALLGILLVWSALTPVAYAIMTPELAWTTWPICVLLVRLTSSVSLASKRITN